MITVFDKRPANHNSFSVLPKLGQADISILRNYFNFEVGLEFGENGVGYGEYYWKLFGFSLEAGPAEIRPYVFNSDLNLIEYPVLVYESWASAPEFKKPPTPAIESNGVGGFTNDGRIGFPYGSGGHINQNGGAFTIWCAWDSEVKGGDYVTKLGWFDDHITPNPMFVKTLKTSNTQPDIETGNYSLGVKVDGIIKGHINFVTHRNADSKDVEIVLMVDNKQVAYIPLL